MNSKPKIYSNINSKTKLHFVGIGGIGMSGIAEVLVILGYKVQGSDMNRSSNVERLESLGAKVFIGHGQENVDEDCILVVSSAIKKNNPELIKANELNLPVMKRAEMLAELLRLKLGVAIAGTHGKTTTTSMLATILEESHLKPTYIIGGIVQNLKRHAQVGEGKYIVAEADESDGSFLFLNPILSCITNIDDDHMDHYKNTENLDEAFFHFANRVPFYGVCSLNADDTRIQNLITKMKKPFVTFGLDENNEVVDVDYLAINIKENALGSEFDLQLKEKIIKGFKIALPGLHNILNALGAISLAHHMEIDFDLIKSSLTKFEGVGRRFELLFSNEQVEIIDDYAHHPTEIKETLKTFSSNRVEREKIVLFEPHRYSRTQDCWDEFLTCFKNVDKVLIFDIYPASEDPIEGITSKKLVQELMKNGVNAECVGSLENMNKLIKNKENPCSLITLGAGAIGKKVRLAIEEVYK